MQIGGGLQAVLVLGSAPYQGRFSLAPCRMIPDNRGIVEVVEPLTTHPAIAEIEIKVETADPTTPGGPAWWQTFPLESDSIKSHVLPLVEGFVPQGSHPFRREWPIVSGTLVKSLPSQNSLLTGFRETV